jgi:hypothetical protein
MGIKCLTLTLSTIRIISIHTTTSVSRRLKILCIMFKIIVFFVIVMFAWLYVSIGILLTMEGTCMAERRFGLTKDRQFLLKGL